MGATIEVAYDLAGPKVWKALFGEDKLTEQEICPMQLRQVIFMQLTTHDASLRKKKTASQEAAVWKELEETQPRLKKMKSLVYQPH